MGHTLLPINVPPLLIVLHIK